MKQLNMKLAALTLGLALSAGTMAQGLSNNDSETGKGSVAVEYKPAAAQTKVTDTTATANETTAAAIKQAAARQAATTIRLDAMYEVERERCNTYPVAATARCQSEMKAGFGKQ